MIEIDGWYYYPHDQVISRRPVTTSETKDEYRTREWNHLRFSLGSVTGLGVIPTLNCRNRCRYCVSSATEGHRDLDINVFKTVLHDAVARYICNAASKDHGVGPFNISITGGGEPTINWKLFTGMVDHTRAYTLSLGIDCKITATTNAADLTSEQLEYLERNLDRVVISYDGTTEIHDRNRPGVDGPNAEKVEKAIRYLSGRRKVTVNTVLVPADTGRLREMMDKIATFNLDMISWTINPMTPAGRGRNIITVSDTPFFDAYSDLLSYAESRYGFKRISTPVIKLKPINMPCDVVEGEPSHLWLCPDGYLRTCIDCPVDPVGAVIDGRVCYEDDYSDVLRKTYEECRTSDTCRECVAFPVCRGGCPAKCINYGGVGTSITCETMKSAWSDVIRKLIAGKEPEGWRLTHLKDEVDAYRVEFLERSASGGNKKITLPELQPFDISVGDVNVTAVAGTDTEAGAVVRDPEGRTYYIPGFELPSDSILNENQN